MTSLVYLDQNAWVALARGSWDKVEFPREHAALIKVVDQVRSNSILVPLTFSNIYETAKINDPVRRANMARAQSLISGGRVFRGRRRILTETLTAYLAWKFAIPHPEPDAQWFLSDLWFESSTDYSPDTYGFEISQRVIDAMRDDPGWALFDYLARSATRMFARRRFAGTASVPWNSSPASSHGALSPPASRLP